MLISLTRVIVSSLLIIIGLLFLYPDENERNLVKGFLIGRLAVPTLAFLGGIIIYLAVFSVAAAAPVITEVVDNGINLGEPLNKTIMLTMSQRDAAFVQSWFPILMSVSTIIIAIILVDNVVVMQRIKHIVTRVPPSKETMKMVKNTLVLSIIIILQAMNFLNGIFYSKILTVLMMGAKEITFTNSHTFINGYEPVKNSLFLRLIDYGTLFIIILMYLSFIGIAASITILYIRKLRKG